MIVTQLLSLLLFHFLSEKALHVYFKNEYKQIYPLVKHSLIYTSILILPSLFLFKDISMMWYFLLIIMLLHYSVNYFYFYFLNFSFSFFKPCVKELDSYLHITCLFYTFWWCIHQ